MVLNHRDSLRLMARSLTPPCRQARERLLLKETFCKSCASSCYSITCILMIMAAVTCSRRPAQAAMRAVQ
jgi:hypothetical protein